VVKGCLFCVEEEGGIFLIFSRGNTKMSISSERRREQRLRYHWPIWFAEDFTGILEQGQMVDISSEGAAFTCRGEGEGVYPGQQLTARFSVPCFGPDDSFDMANFVRRGEVCRVEGGFGHSRKVAVQFAEPLPFKPGEQEYAQQDEVRELAGAAL
jgi:hypothetical protein